MPVTMFFHWIGSASVPLPNRCVGMNNDTCSPSWSRLDSKSRLVLVRRSIPFSPSLTSVSSEAVGSDAGPERSRLAYRMSERLWEQKRVIRYYLHRWPSQRAMKRLREKGPRPHRSPSRRYQDRDGDRRSQPDPDTGATATGAVSDLSLEAA